MSVRIKGGRHDKNETSSRDEEKTGVWLIIYALHQQTIGGEEISIL